MSRYVKQVGPNLSLFNVNHGNNSVLAHEGCGGLIVRKAKREIQAYPPRNAAGKIYCLECGHRAGRGLVALIKHNKNRNHIHVAGAAGRSIDLVAEIHFSRHPEDRAFGGDYHIFRWVSSDYARSMTNLSKRDRLPQVVPSIEEMVGTASKEQERDQDFFRRLDEIRERGRSRENNKVPTLTATLDRASSAGRSLRESNTRRWLRERSRGETPKRKVVEIKMPPAMYATAPGRPSMFNDEELEQIRQAKKRMKI